MVGVVCWDLLEPEWIKKHTFKMVISQRRRPFGDQRAANEMSRRDKVAQNSHTAEGRDKAGTRSLTISGEKWERIEYYCWWACCRGLDAVSCSFFHALSEKWVSERGRSSACMHVVPLTTWSWFVNSGLRCQHQYWVGGRRAQSLWSL